MHCIFMHGFEDWWSKSCGLEVLILGWPSNQLIIVEGMNVSVAMSLSRGIYQILQEEILESTFWNIKCDYQNTGAN